MQWMDQADLRTLPFSTKESLFLCQNFCAQANFIISLISVFVSEFLQKAGSEDFPFFTAKNRCTPGIKRDLTNCMVIFTKADEILRPLPFLPLVHYSLSSVCDFEWQMFPVIGLLVARSATLEGRTFRP